MCIEKGVFYPFPLWGSTWKLKISLPENLILMMPQSKSLLDFLHLTLLKERREIQKAFRIFL